MSTIRAAGLGTLTASNTATIVDPQTPANGIARLSPLVSYSAVASTSGTAIDFTGIPSWSRRVTLILNGNSTSGSNHNPRIQLGTSSGIDSTGNYTKVSGYYGTSQLCSGTTTGSGFDVSWGGSSSAGFTGTLVFYNITSNTWILDGSLIDTAGLGYMIKIVGSKTLTGVLDRVRLTTDGGLTFDAGTVNCFYE